jgi:hypothetical protein
MEGANVGEASSYVAKSAEDMIDYLSYSKEEGKINGTTFILQDVVPGSEVSTEAWFSNGELIGSSINTTWETKKFLAGELGQRTGAETSLVCGYKDPPALFRGTVSKIQPLLKHAKWTGPIDVNAIVSEKDRKPYFLEFTPRFGYSAIFAYATILGCGVGEFLKGVVTGGFKVPYKATWGTALKLSVPPYPCDIKDKKASKETYGEPAGMVVKGVENKDFYKVDVMKNRHGRLVTAGTTGIVGECMGRGESIMSAWRASQKVFESIEAPNKQGRFTDGVEDAWKRVNQLKKWGFDIPENKISAGTKTVNPFDVRVPAE